MAESNSSMQSSMFLPTFLQQLANPEVKTVMIAGCGGGFDFVHGMLLYPELKRLNKKIIIGSFSFGKPENYKDAETYHTFESGVVVKKVCAENTGAFFYAPEVHMCDYLDEKYPEEEPHSVYAYYARSYTVKMLKELYEKIIKENNVDGLIIIDGGSDSLMIGDEEGLGDPIEDCVSVTTASLLEGLKAKMLLSVGFGADRFNGVSDCASLRAVADLTSKGGFLGSISIEQSNPGYTFYRDCVKHIYSKQTFKSVLTGLILTSARGCYGSDIVPEELQPRVKKGSAFIWPLMAFIWGFDIQKVTDRSLVSSWIKDCNTVGECYTELKKGRKDLEAVGKLRGVENLPSQRSMDSATNVFCG